MVTYMNDKKIRTMEDVRAFLAGSAAMECSITDKAQRHRWIEQTLRRFNYRTPGTVRSRRDPALPAPRQRLFSPDAHPPRCLRGRNLSET